MAKKPLNEKVQRLIKERYFPLILRRFKEKRPFRMLPPTKSTYNYIPQIILSRHGVNRNEFINLNKLIEMEIDYYAICDSPWNLTSTMRDKIIFVCTYVLFDLCDNACYDSIRSWLDNEVLPKKLDTKI